MPRRPTSIPTPSTTTARPSSSATSTRVWSGWWAAQPMSSRGWWPRPGRPTRTRASGPSRLPGLTFQDGSPCDSAAVKASYERLLAMGRGAVNVVSRFVSDPEQIDDARSGDDRLQSRQAAAALPSAMAATYGPADRQRQGRHGARGGGRLRQRLAAAHRRGDRHRTLEARLVRAGTRRPSWSGTTTTGAAGKATTSSGSSSASSKRARRCASSSKPATSTSWTATASTTNGSASCRRIRRSTSISATAPRSTFQIMTVSGPLASPEARQAMCYAYPSGSHRRRPTGYARRANSPVAPEVLGYPEDAFFYETDLAKAKELLDAAGVAEGTELLAATTISSDTSIVWSCSRPIWPRSASR